MLLYVCFRAAKHEKPTLSASKSKKACAKQVFQLFATRMRGELLKITAFDVPEKVPYPFPGTPLQSLDDLTF